MTANRPPWTCDVSICMNAGYGARTAWQKMGEGRGEKRREARYGVGARDGRAPCAKGRLLT